MNVAMIPARGGSKRIPKKNIREFCGKPMMAWSIEAALAAGCFERVIVSTDDPHIAEVARQYGAETPFLRPPELSSDYAATLPVVRHAVNHLLEQKVSVANVCCIYPTAPLLRPEFLLAGLSLLEESADADFVFSAGEFSYPVPRALLVDPQGWLKMAWPENESVRSQDLPRYYHDAGQFYWGKSEAWQTCGQLLSAKTKMVLLPSLLVRDIDTPADWIHAELMAKFLLQTSPDFRLNNGERS